MQPTQSNRGVIAPALLLLALVAGTGLALEWRVQKQEPKKETEVHNPAVQRREMIDALHAINQQLEVMTKSLQSLERIETAQLRLQFEQQKAKPAEEKEPTE